MRAPLILCGSIVVAVLLLVYLSAIGGRDEVNELALGEETQVYFAKIEGRAIHCEGKSDGQTCFDAMDQFPLESRTLWLGNSQLHAINQLKADDQSAVEILHQALFDQGNYVVAFSQPNANLQEHYVLLEHFRLRGSLDYLVLPIVFDDFRETGVRSDLLAFLNDDALRLTLLETDLGKSIVKEYESTLPVADELNPSINPESLQERSESFLNDFLSKNLDFWQNRGTLRSEVFLNLYLLRNTVLGINPSSVRRIIKGRYKRNMRALELILSSCIRNGIAPILYIVPIRSDVQVPYDREEYAMFVEDLIKITKDKKVSLHDMSKAVPARYWGSKDATGLGGENELDFMHFQGGGHRILADRIEQLLTSLEQ
jgi:hypothetical protein